MFTVLEKYISSKIVVTKNELDIIKNCFQPKKLRKKQYLLQEGEVCNFIAFICKGSMRLYRVDEKENEYIVQFGFENWWITDRESNLTQLPTIYNIDAIEDSELLLIHPTKLEELRNKIPTFGKMMQQLQIKNFVAIQKRINAALSFTAEEKYIELLQNQPEILQKVSSTMVASYLGISRETLSRIKSIYHRKLIL